MQLLYSLFGVSRLKDSNKRVVICHLMASIVGVHLIALLIVLNLFDKYIYNLINENSNKVIFTAEFYFCFCLLLMMTFKIYFNLSMHRKIKTHTTFICSFCAVFLIATSYIFLYYPYPDRLESRQEYLLHSSVLLSLFYFAAFFWDRYRFLSAYLFEKSVRSSDRKKDFLRYFEIAMVWLLAIVSLALWLLIATDVLSFTYE